MQQSSVQYRKVASLTRRIGIALGMASVIAMVPMSNAMAAGYTVTSAKHGHKNDIPLDLSQRAVNYCAKKGMNFNPKKQPNGKPGGDQLAPINYYTVKDKNGGKWWKGSLNFKCS